MVSFGINTGGDFIGTSGAANATRTGGIRGTGATTRLFVAGRFIARVARLFEARAARFRRAELRREFELDESTFGAR